MVWVVGEGIEHGQAMLSAAEILSLWIGGGGEYPRRFSPKLGILGLI